MSLKNFGPLVLCCLEYLNCKKNFRSKALYCANVEPYCVQFWPLEFMESSDDQKIWGQQYLRYLYPWNVLFQFHPTQLNHKPAKMPIAQCHWDHIGIGVILEGNLKLSSMHITQRSSVVFAGKGLVSYMYMIQTVRDDYCREQHRGWQACADIRSP